MLFLLQNNSAWTRVCLKMHSRHLHAPFGGIFAPNSKTGSGAVRTDRRTAERRFMLIGQFQNNYSGVGDTGRKMKAALKVDTANASYDEIQQLLNDFLEQGKVEEDYLNEVRQYKDSQRNSGEMAGYQQTLQAYYAMQNLAHEPVYVETENGLQQVQYREGELTSGILGLGCCGNSTYYAKYAKDSTAENPVVEICVENEKGKKTYAVDVCSVDPEDATEMEMFAILSHYEKQGIYPDDGLLRFRGKSEEIFRAQNMLQFLYEKQNWFER